MARSSGNTVVALEANLREITELIKELNQNKKELENFGGAAAEIRKITAQVKELEKITRNIGWNRTTNNWGKNANTEGRNPTQNANDIKETYKQLTAGTTEYNRALAKLEDTQNKFNKSIEKTALSWDKYMIAQEDVLSLSPQLEESYQNIRSQLMSATKPEEIESATLDWERFKKSLQDVAVAASNITRAFNEEEEAARMAMAGQMAAADALAQTIKVKLVDGAWNLALKMLHSIIEATKTLDAELVEIRKVTDFSEAELTAFVKNIQEIGNRTATTTSQLLEATAVFARSGYTKQQIALLTEEAAVLKNVSDGITDMSKAAETLISVMKAYNVDAEHARDITDTLNAISNKSAISFDDLAEGLSRVGSVFASQDTSIAQLSAMLTGANEILQNIEKTSTGLKTISQRLRGISNETNEEGVNLASLQGIVSDITSKYGEAVRITDEHTGQLRGTYDIISDLAEVWTSMSKNEQQLLGEKIAGKTQITVLQALLNNWESVENAIKNAENAAGSAAREQEAYVNSLTGAINKFKATLENMYASVIDSSLLASIVNMGTGLLNILNQIGLSPIVAGLLSGGFVGKLSSLYAKLEQMKSTLSPVTNLLKSFTNKDKGLIDNVKSIVKGLKSSREELVGSNQRLYDLLKKQTALNLSKAEELELNTIIKTTDEAQIKLVGEKIALERVSNALVSVGIGLAVAGIAFIYNKLKELDEKRRAAINDSFAEYESKLEEIKSRIKEINDAIESEGGKTTQKQVEELQELNEELRVTEVLAERARKKVVELAAGSAVISGKRTATAFGKTADIGGSERRQVTNEKLGWDFSVALSDFEAFYDAQGNLLKDKYYEAYDFVRSTAAEGSKEIAETVGDEWWKQISEEFEKLRGLVNEETERLNHVVTLGITKESLTNFLADQFKDIAWDEVTQKINWGKVAKSINSDTLIDFYKKIFGNFMDSSDFEKAYDRLNTINAESIEKWQKTYSEIMAVDRALGEYVDLYAKAGALSSSEILNVLENWEKYADILTVDVNGNLAISKELVVARAEAELLAIKNTLIAKADEAEAEIARQKIQLEAAQRALEGAKAEVQAVNKVIEANLKLTKVLKNQQAVAKGLSPDDTLLSSSEISKWQTEVNSLTTAIGNQQAYVDNLRAQIEAIDKIDLDKLLAKAASGTKSATKATEELNEELTKLKDILSVLQKEMTDTTDVYQKVQAAMKDIVQAEIDAIEAENDLLDENMKYYKARITLIEEYYESGIDELKKQRDAAIEANEAEQQALEDKIDALKEATDEYEKQNEAAQDAIDEQVKALEAQIDALDEANDAREKEIEMQERLLNIEKARLAMEKAKDAYEAAKASKTVRTYDAQRGWIYTADQSAVASAYSEYQSAQKSYQDLLDELAKAQAEAELQAQKDAIQAQIDELKEQKEALKEQLEQTKEDAEQQEKNWKEEIDLLKTQKDEIKEKFEAQIDELEKQSDSISNIEDDVDRLLDRYLNDEDVIAWAEAYKNASEEERAAMEAELKARWGADKTSQAENEARIADLKSLIKDIEGMLETTEEILESEGVKAWLESFTAGDLSDKNSMVAEMKRAYQEFYTNQKAEIDKVQAAIDKLEGTLTTTNSILAANWGTGKENTPVNSYASGGVVDSGLLMNTGMLSNRVKVHGTPSSPELILNGRQQANLLYRLGQQKPSVVTNNSPSASNSMYIATLNIQADSQDTLYGLLLQAKQLATIS